MSNLKTWPDPDTQFNEQSRNDMNMTYLLSPSTGKAVEPAGSSASNQRVNAQSGDFVAGAITDLATLLTLAGTSGDANTVASLMGRLTKIRDLLSGDLFVKGDFTEQASLSAGALNADLLPSTDVSAYQGVSLHILSSAYSGTLIWRGSNDGTNWYQFNAIDINVSSGYSSSASSTNVIYFLPRFFRYLRVRMETYSSGTAQAIAEFYTQSPLWVPKATLAATQSGTWTVQPGNTQNTTPWLTQGPTNTATQAANTASNTVVKGSAGALWTATITTLGTAGLIIYDNASTNSGTILLSIPASAAVGTIYNFPAGQPAANGIVSAGVTNCPAVTFAYR